MPENSKSKKLAAARKKLKEYQAKDKHNEYVQADHKDDTNQNIKENTDRILIESSEQNKNAEECSDTTYIEQCSGFMDSQKDKPIENNITSTEEIGTHILEHIPHSNTIELLIGEKSTLRSELVKCQSECKRKSLEIEEINESLNASNSRVEKLEKDIHQLQLQNVNLNQNVEKLNHHIHCANEEVTKLQIENNESIEHIAELKQSFNQELNKVKTLEDKLKEKECEVELNKIRINQISDEVSVETDSKIEILTQTKFVYEQQIRDLQLMVQQLEVEREQASQQYQSYVQHLNKEMAIISEKSLKLNEENANLIRREQSLIQHIGELEKQIQQSISQKTHSNEEISQISTECLKKDAEQNSVEQEKLQELQERIEILQQELNRTQQTLDDKCNIIMLQEKKIENLTLIKSDSSKLLAEIESDKLAASRAVSQNEELKKQLDEIQIKLIQLTNDKAELINKLDSEQYTNREMRSNYTKLEDDIQQINNRLHFKDEEMIRLTNENMDLNQQIDEFKKTKNILENSNFAHGDNNAIQTVEMINNCEENEKLEDAFTNQNNDYTDGKRDNTEGLAPTEAMLKLEERFTSLMSDIANLTEEKQRLEHLVLQLQGETETIGEYVSLYQTQRRMLKQREIEKNNQLQKIAIERDQMKEKIILLSNLVNKLIQQNDTPLNDENILNEATISHNNQQMDAMLSSDKTNPRDIIYTIKNIVSDIKEKQNAETDLNIVPSLDHCSCCSGKFETI